MSYVISQSSHFPNVTTEVIWEMITDWKQVDYELWPINMTHPDCFQKLDDIPADGQVHFASCLRLGFLPFDRHCFSLQEICAPSHFCERSTNLFLKEWTHRRQIRADGDGVLLEDHCTLRPRLRLLGPLLAGIYRWVFRRRHNRVRKQLAIQDLDVR